MSRLFCGMLLGTVVLCAACFVCSAEAAGPPIDEVWMRYGGARLYYNAVNQPQQMDMNGMSRRDPALIKSLPPITAQGAPATVRRKSSAAPKKVAPAPAVAPGSAANKGMLPATPGSSQKLTAPTTPNSSVSAIAPAAKADVPAQTRNGSLARPEQKDDVFIPPANTPAPRVPAGAAAFSATTTTAQGQGGGMQGGGATRAGQASGVPAGARP